MIDYKKRWLERKKRKGPRGFTPLIDNQPLEVAQPKIPTDWELLKEFHDETDPRDICERHLLEDFVRKLLKTLSERERKVLYCRFWLTMPLEEVGELFNISGNRVRQLEAKALRKLRHPSRMDTIPDQDYYTWIPLREKKEREAEEALLQKEREERDARIQASEEQFRKECEEEAKIREKEWEERVYYYRKWDNEIKENIKKEKEKDKRTYTWNSFTRTRTYSDGTTEIIERE